MERGMVRFGQATKQKIFILNQGILNFIGMFESTNKILPKYSLRLRI